MAQEWNMRHVLIDKQGNFGSIAGLPPAAMRYTEARHVADRGADARRPQARHGRLRADLRRAAHRADACCRRSSRTCWSTAPAASRSAWRPRIPPHNLGEVCEALIALIDDPEVSIDELMEIIPGPDFPTGGIICGRSGIRRGYHTGRSTVVVRARTTIEETGQAAPDRRSTRSPTSRPATASRSGSPRWSTRAGSRASPACATRAT